MFYVQWLFCFLKDCAVYGIMWKTIVELGRLQMAVWRMHIAWWTTKATKTHSEYVLCIAFPRQQRFHERTSVLLYVQYIAWGVITLRE